MALPTILIVEDDQPTAAVLMLTLQMGGYQVLNANSGAEALRLARLHRREIALTLCDVVLQDRTGPEVARRIRELCPQMKTLFTSGYPFSHLVERNLFTAETLQNESTFYIEKPFWPKQLLQLVNGILPAVQMQAMGMGHTGVALVSAAH